MCTGMEAIALASAAASTGGALHNKQQQNDAIAAQNAENARTTQMQADARAQEVVRQRAMEDLQAAEVTKALTEADPTKLAEDAEAASIDPENPVMAAFENYIAPTTTGAVENKDVNDNVGATIAAATKRTRGLLRNAALLSGQDAAFNDATQALTRMGGNVQNIGSRRQGSNNVARLETSIPGASVRASDSPLGDILMIGGSLGGAYGGANLDSGSSLFKLGNLFKKKPLNAIPALGEVTV